MHFFAQEKLFPASLFLVLQGQFSEVLLFPPVMVCECPTGWELQTQRAGACPDSPLREERGKTQGSGREPGVQGEQRDARSRVCSGKGEQAV